MRKLKRDELFYTEPYRSIINLLNAEMFKSGLTQGDFRYLLIKDKDNVKVTHIIERFNEILPRLIKKSIITPNCVSSKQYLNKCLNRLLDEQIITTDKRTKKFKRYKLKPEIPYEIYKRTLQELIVIHESAPSILEYDYKDTVSILYGFTQPYYDLLTGEQFYKEFSSDVKDKLKYHIDEINRHLCDIDLLRYDNEEDYELYELYKKYFKYRYDRDDKYYSVCELTQFFLHMQMEYYFDNVLKIQKNKELMTSHLRDLWGGLSDSVDIIGEILPDEIINKVEYMWYSSPYMDDLMFKDVDKKVPKRYIENELGKHRDIVIEIIQSICGMNDFDANTFYDDMLTYFKDNTELFVFPLASDLVFISSPKRIRDIYSSEVQDKYISSGGSMRFGDMAFRFKTPNNHLTT